jgi:hypothetical protein
MFPSDSQVVPDCIRVLLWTWRVIRRGEEPGAQMGRSSEWEGEGSVAVAGLQVGIVVREL